MSAQQALTASGGIAKTRTILNTGVPEAEIYRLRRSGKLLTPRHGWIALPDADPELLFAVTHGVMLTCVTQAKRLGLWTITTPTRHVSASSRARANPQSCEVHWGKPLVPRPPEALADPLLNVLHYVAVCRPFDEALVVWESALNKGLVDLEQLSQLPLRSRAQQLLKSCRPFSDSGLESLAASRLKWLGVRLVQQAKILGHRVDLLIGERLVLQIDGATHTGTQRDLDNTFDAQLRKRGYHVIRVSYRQIMFDWPSAQLQVMEAVAHGLHLSKR